MINLTAQSKSYGNTSQYIARLAGRDAKFGYRREFVGRKSGSFTEALVDEAGIYEVMDIDKKGRKDVGFRLVIARPSNCPPLSTGDPEFMNFTATESDVMTITKRLDKGESLDEMIDPRLNADGNHYEFDLRSPGAAKRAAKASTLESVTDQCWALLQNMPEKEAKAVLAALKMRISPPKVTAPTAEPAPLTEEEGPETERAIIV